MLISKKITSSTFLFLLFIGRFGQTFGDTGSTQDFSLGKNCVAASCFGSQAKTEKVQKSQCQSNDEIQPIIEFKAGYFFFADGKMRKIYNEGGLDLQIAGSYPIWKWMQIYGSVEFIEKHGRSLHGHQKARIWEYPISLGLKSVVKICKNTQYYLTIGPRYFFVHTHANSSHIDKTMNQNGIGGFAGTGFNFLPTDHLLIDVFGEYSYCRLHFHPHKKHTYGRSIQVGGFAFGAGLGYAF
jgi:hypothetical protein